MEEKTFRDLELKIGDEVFVSGSCCVNIEKGKIIEINENSPKIFFPDKNKEEIITNSELIHSADDEFYSEIFDLQEKGRKIFEKFKQESEKEEPEEQEVPVKEVKPQKPKSSQQKQKDRSKETIIKIRIPKQFHHFH